MNVRSLHRTGTILIMVCLATLSVACGRSSNSGKSVFWLVRSRAHRTVLAKFRHLCQDRVIPLEIKQDLKKG